MMRVIYTDEPENFLVMRDATVEYEPGTARDLNDPASALTQYDMSAFE